MLCLAASLLATNCGCTSLPIHRAAEPLPPGGMVPESVPRELSKTVLPTYTVAPPDILQINAVHVVPKSPYFLRVFDVLELELERSETDIFQQGDVIQITAPGAFQTAPIDGLFVVQSSGAVDLGYNYGAVRVAGLTREKAQQEIVKHLAVTLKEPATTVYLVEASEPIQGNFTVQLGGAVNFGGRYGTVHVAGRTIEDAQNVIQQHLSQFFVNPKINASIIESGAQQEIAGEHLVGPDGTVTLGSYGSVLVVGMTIAQAKLAIESHLSQFLDAPEVSVSVFSYNSKVYYLITQGAGMGDGVYRFPVTGNDTVLDAVAQINGLEPVSSKKIWIARPSPCSDACQILEVDWHGITAMAQAGTNYQILPGDRVFVAEDKLVAFDSALSKLIAPVERVMGFTILGTSTATRLSGSVLKGGGNPRGSGTF
jgi:polysaccharide biosynthesis/export protein